MIFEDEELRQKAIKSYCEDCEHWVKNECSKRSHWLERYQDKDGLDWIYCQSCISKVLRKLNESRDKEKQLYSCGIPLCFSTIEEIKKLINKRYPDECKSSSDIS